MLARGSAILCSGVQMNPLTSILYKYKYKYIYIYIYIVSLILKFILENIFFAHPDLNFIYPYYKYFQL